MERRQLVREWVLNAVTDDYENVDECILADVGKFAARYGWTITRAEIVDALRALVAAGLVKAYRLSPFPPFCTELNRMPPLRVEKNFKTYFYATKKGIVQSGADASCIRGE